MCNVLKKKFKAIFNAFSRILVHCVAFCIKPVKRPKPFAKYSRYQTCRRLSPCVNPPVRSSIIGPARLVH